jgi:hypothetical protein
MSALTARRRRQQARRALADKRASDPLYQEIAALKRARKGERVKPGASLPDLSCPSRAAPLSNVIPKGCMTPQAARFDDPECVAAWYRTKARIAKETREP